MTSCLGHGLAPTQVAAGDALAEAEQVGDDVFVVAGKHTARAAEAGGDLVGDQQHVELVAQLADAGEIARRVDDHPGRAHDQRFYADGRDRVAVLHENRPQAGECVRADLLRRVVRAVDDRGAREVRLKQHRPVRPVERRRPADAHAADGVAVVALGQPDELALFRPALVPPELRRHLERRLRRRRAAVAVEDFRQPRRGDGDQLLRQHARRLVRQAEQRGVGDLLELVANGCVDLRHPVAVDVAPKRRRPVEVPSPLAVDYVDAVAMRDDQRVVGQPQRHVRERVPDELFIAVLKINGCHGCHGLVLKAVLCPAPARP